MFYIIVIVATTLLVGGCSVLGQRQFGQRPKKERLERIKRSPNYKNGEFQNLSPTPLKTTSKSYFRLFWETFMQKPVEVAPKTAIPAIKTNLTALSDHSLVWLGHSSYLMKIDGKIYLIDPVFGSASPFSFSLKPFKGADIYTTDDLPEVDFLIITHDHYDHLEYTTMLKLKDKVKRVITPLGVGQHLEYWSFSAEKITELDWNEAFSLSEDAKIEALPARHGSGRRFKLRQTLWASFMLQTPSLTIYIGGDGGYDTHFKEIGARFPKIDWAILENGQYSENWRYVHLSPEDLINAIKDLNAKQILAFHNSKYALSRHKWYEPLANISEAAEKWNIRLATPKIGEVVRLNDEAQSFEKWWQTAF